MLLSIARDVEQLVGLMKRRGQEEEGVSIGAQRARRLLLYVKDGDRCMGLFDNNISRELSKVAFVPLLLPVMVEPGGHVEFKQDIVRFSGALASSQAALGFSVLPILEEDIAPPHIFHSTLGVNSSPNVSTVLKHLYNLTANGKGAGLDRWNITGQTAEATFGAIFGYLNDHWSAVAAPIQANLTNSNIVPVGHMLIRPGRLFFRLTEDLSPFMHEVPRHFGVHEAFLKRLGIKETPSASDYCDFLKNSERRATGILLNANELRAIVTVIQSIASDGGKAARLCVPDENSVLQPVGQCLINDDPWLPLRAGTTIPLIGMTVLHPAIPHRVARQLGISCISSVFIEEHGFSREHPPVAAAEEGQMLATMRQQLSSESFIRATIALMSSGAGGTASISSFSSAVVDSSAIRGEEQLAVMLRSSEFRFVQSVPTFLRLGDDFRTGQAGGRQAQQSERVLRQETAEDSLFFYSREHGNIYINTSLLRGAHHTRSGGLCVHLQNDRPDTSLAAAVAALMLSAAVDAQVAPGSSTGASRPHRVLTPCR